MNYIEVYSVSFDWNKASVVRPANIYGEHDNFRTRIYGNRITVRKDYFEKRTSDEICWGDGSPIRDFIYGGDVADGIINVYEQKLTQPINLGSGEVLSIRRMIETCRYIRRKW